MKLFKQIITFFKRILRRFTYYRLNKKLTKVAVKKKNERLKLRYEVAKYIQSFAKLDKDNKSKYIPLDKKTKELIKFNVSEKFGDNMAKLNVRLNNKLQVI